MVKASSVEETRTDEDDRKDSGHYETQSPENNSRMMLCWHKQHLLAYFLNKLSNAARALAGFKLAGVEVSFSRVTRIS